MYFKIHKHNVNSTLHVGSIFKHEITYK